MRQVSPLAIMGRWPCLCLCVWLAFPLLAIVVVIPNMKLTPPEKGWRVKDHPAAIAIDALTLASRAPSIAYEANGPPPSPPDCAVYLETAGCTWTETWVCPDDYMGQGHVANNDGSDGFYCCCQWDGEPPPAARARTARRLEHGAQAGDTLGTGLPARLESLGRVGEGGEQRLLPGRWWGDGGEVVGSGHGVGHGVGRSRLCVAAQCVAAHDRVGAAPRQQHAATSAFGDLTLLEEQRPAAARRHAGLGAVSE